MYLERYRMEASKYQIWNNCEKDVIFLTPIHKLIDFGLNMYLNFPKQDITWSLETNSVCKISLGGGVY